MLARRSLAASLLAIASPAAALAQEDPPLSLSANVSLVSDYYFRGLTQTWHQPAIQGGFDAAHGSGLYAGVWASNVSGKQYAGGSMEMDLYGGYNYKLNEDITLGAGLIYYWYPGANTDEAAGRASAACPDQRYDTLEGSLSAAWKWLSFKWSYAFTDYFGGNADTGFEADTDGSMYFDLTASIPLQVLGGINIVGHIGYTLYSEELAAPVNGETDPSYSDWKLGLTKTWDSGWNLGLFYVQADNDVWEDAQALSTTRPDTEDLNKGTVYLQVGRTF